MHVDGASKVGCGLMSSLFVSGAMLVCACSSGGDASGYSASPASADASAGNTEGGSPGNTPSRDAGGGEDARASNGDGGGSGGASAGCGAAVVCDDFEKGVVGQPPPSPWTVSAPSCTGTGALAIDDSQAHSGVRSVKVTGAGGYCNHIFFGTSAPEPLQDSLWARFFVRLDTALGDGHVTFLAMKDAHDGKDLRMGGQSKILMYNRESDDATLPALSPAGIAKSLVPPTGQWMCVELHVDGTARAIQTWVNGNAVEGLVVDGTSTPDVDDQWLRGSSWAPKLADVRFGWESYGGQSETLWFDDVAVGSSRIGCGP
jgi:hypothetical protein